MTVSSEMKSSSGFEIGVDIGGTFTDVVCREPGGRMRLMKVPTTRADPSEAVLRSLAAMRESWSLDASRIARFSHGTTVATNAVLERKGARIGIITTAGFRDIIEIGRQLRRAVYSVVLEPDTPGFLAPGKFRREVAERLSATGEVVTPLDEQAVIKAADELVATGAEAIAICFLFSFLNPVHERRARALIEARHPGIMMSVSHEVDPAFREYERTVATAFDAYVKPVVDRYLAHLESGLENAKIGAPLQVMQSRGGLSVATVARQRPVRLFLSGPAAGVIGGQIVGASASFDNLITIDIGGTSADIALIGGRKPMLRPEGLVGGYALRVPMVDVNTIGAGGGSIARVDGAGGLRVGPHSAGSEPGPACYGRGGTEPTVTDASIVLGYLDPDYFAAGTMKLDRRLSEAVIDDRLAGPLGISREAAALGIHRVLNAQMAEGIRLVSVRQGIDPREFALVPLGGAGGIHATVLARELKMTRVIVPRIAGVLAAAGLLAAPIEHEVSATHVAVLPNIDLDALKAALAASDARADALMQVEQLNGAAVRISYLADVCYVGQSYTLEIPFDPNEANLGTALYDRFLEAHDRVFGHSVNGPAKIVSLRAVHQAGGSEVLDEMRFAPLDGPVEIGTRDILVEGHEGWLKARIFDRETMPIGFKFAGPAVVQQPDTTTLIEPGWFGVVDDAGNLVLTTA
jgi:N-methylhydantoinase A